jgi:hypothetical protein
MEAGLSGIWQQALPSTPPTTSTLRQAHRMRMPATITSLKYDSAGQLLW